MLVAAGHAKMAARAGQQKWATLPGLGQLLHFCPCPRGHLLSAGDWDTSEIHPRRLQRNSIHVLVRDALRTNFISLSLFSEQKQMGRWMISEVLERFRPKSLVCSGMH